MWEKQRDCRTSEREPGGRCPQAESEPWQVYAKRFPSAGSAKWQLSTSGADWLVGLRTDGREVYFIRLKE